MTTQKRRVIYMTDVDWDRVTRRAAKAGTTISALLRDLASVPAGPGFGHPVPAPKPK